MKAAVSCFLQKYIKAKYSEIKDYALCLRNISKDFTINNMNKINKCFSVDLIRLILTIFWISINI